MIRLKKILLSSDQNTTTFNALYNGYMLVFDPECPNVTPWPEYDPTYYQGDIGFSFSTTHKLAQDKPTVTVMIPIDRLPSDNTSDAAADFYLRAFSRYIEELNAELYNRSRPDYENGRYYIASPGGEILKRNYAYFALCPPKDYENVSGVRVNILHEGKRPQAKICLCIKLLVQLPRKKMKKTISMLCRDLPREVLRFVDEIDRERLYATVALSEKQSAIRNYLKGSEYCAFIANGSILPRAKGTDLPLEDAVSFKAPKGSEIEICGVLGMGIRKGVTVITGGGYSGKSTLLDAISAGICDHVLGDGRELCITDESAMTISAEDGRCVKRLNISPFIKWLPCGDTSDFSTDHASGSTSQAANIMEAVDIGARLLVIDEDRSATNFMIRDKMMKRLIEKEPITPFTDRAGELYESLGVSTVLVIGGSGEYLSVADRIYLMDDYIIYDVTDKGKEICRMQANREICPNADWTQKRVLTSKNFSSFPGGKGSERLLVSDMGFIVIGDERIDVRGIHDILSPRQTDALAFMLRYIEISNSDSLIDIKRKADELYERIAREGIDFLYSPYFTTCERFLDLPRKQELLALVCRMRNVSYSR